MLAIASGSCFLETAGTLSVATTTHSASSGQDFSIHSDHLQAMPFATTLVIPEASFAIRGQRQLNPICSKCRILKDCC